MGRSDLGHALGRIERLAASGRDVASLFIEAGEVISEAVPSAMDANDVPFWYTADPDSELVTSVVGTDCQWSFADVMRFEYDEDDFNKVADVFANPRGIQTLHDATDGDLERSAAYRTYLKEVGIGQEALLALRSRRGQHWGALRVVRGTDGPTFTGAELRFLRAASVHLADGARRGLLTGSAQDADGETAPGMIVLDGLDVASMTPAAERLLHELDGWEPGDDLPPAVLAVASEGAEAEARVLSRSGAWMLLHAAPMSDGPTVGVIVERAHPARIAPLLMELYELTEREKDVTMLVLLGRSTRQISRELTLSEHTVQQHVKNVFAKTDTRSRRELVSNVFYDAYDPRVTDNAGRQLAELPIRGGPWTNGSRSSPTPRRSP